MGDRRLSIHDSKIEMSVVGRLTMFFSAGCQEKYFCLTMVVFYKQRNKSWIWSPLHSASVLVGMMESEAHCFCIQPRRQYTALISLALHKRQCA